MKNDIFEFYLSKNDQQKSCLLALRDIILNCDEHITETLKYGMPCFRWKNRIFCYLWIESKTENPYILMVEGKRLDHPQLEIGNRKRMKILRVDPNKDLSIGIINEILKQALDLYRSDL